MAEEAVLNIAHKKIQKRSEVEYNEKIAKES
jgi:hypothetical protein